jgi:hypothetical protein
MDDFNTLFIGWYFVCVMGPYIRNVYIFFVVFPEYVFQILKKMMENIDPRYAHSRDFFFTRISYLWIDFVIDSLQKESKESKNILTQLLPVYSIWDIDYQYDGQNKSKTFCNAYEYKYNNNGIFKNAFDISCNIEDVIHCLVYYQDIGIGNGLYSSSFYNSFEFLLIKYLLQEIVELYFHKNFP